ncbi:MAG: RNA polymerase-binding protein RbpA [Actinomycetota bacterium]|nr:RNA polymerase-binding protein RbpA [Actinomycetota bacterium]
MADRTLRGSRLGAVSYETDYGVDVAARVFTEYRCPNGHSFTMPFAHDAEIPPTWECRIDGLPAEVVDGPAPAQKKAKPPRTHWDMLIERRTIADLEEVLAERLEFLKARRGVKSA